MRPVAGPRVAVSAAVVRDGRLLLVRRARPPHAGLMALPGGKVKTGETLDQALVRELREETGLEGIPRELVAAFDILDRDAHGVLQAHFVLLVKRVEVASGTATPGGDALALHWLDRVGLEAAGSDVTTTTLDIGRALLPARQGRP